MKKKNKSVDKKEIAKSKIKELQQESIIINALNKLLEEQLQKKRVQKNEDNIHSRREIEQENIILKELSSYGLFSNIKRNERRNRLELYYDIIFTILQESSKGQVKPTRVQFLANTAYDRLMKYLKVLQSKGLITSSPIVLTEKGKQFLIDYEKMNYFNKRMSFNYF